MTLQALEAKGYRDAWLNRPAQSDDSAYLAGWSEGVADAAKAARRPSVDPALSKAAVGRVRQRAKGQGDNSFLFGAKA